MFQCLGDNETSMVLVEVHCGVCSSHIGGKSPGPQAVKCGILLAYSDKGYHRFCQEVQSIPKT